MHTDFHTIIIGAGPGGLACAAKLASSGKNALVLERNTHIGPKVCAGGIPYHAMSALHYPDTIFCRHFHEQHVYTPRQHAVVKAATPIISTAKRADLGAWMLERAQSCGARILAGCTVRKIHPNVVETKQGSFSFKYLVGADGSHSLVRRHLGLPSQQVGVGIHAMVPGTFKHMEWHLDPALFRSGYAWIFPFDQSASIGAYASRMDLSPVKLQQRFEHWATLRGLDLANIKTRAALINFDYRGYKFGRQFLVGDAAGLASGFTGEGIFPAILSGELVAAEIVHQRSEAARFKKMLHKHRLHCRLQKFFSGNKQICQMALEVLVLGLRLNLISFKHLEMA